MVAHDAVYLYSYVLRIVASISVDKIAIAAITVNIRKWTVKSSALGEMMFRKYFKGRLEVKNAARTKLENKPETKPENKLKTKLSNNRTVI